MLTATESRRIDSELLQILNELPHRTVIRTNDSDALTRVDPGESGDDFGRMAPARMANEELFLAFEPTRNQRIGVADGNGLCGGDAERITVRIGLHSCNQSHAGERYMVLPAEFHEAPTYSPHTIRKPDEKRGTLLFASSRDVFRDIFSRIEPLAELIAQVESGGMQTVVAHRRKQWIPIGIETQLTDHFACGVSPSTIQ